MRLPSVGAAAARSDDPRAALTDAPDQGHSHCCVRGSRRVGETPAMRRSRSCPPVDLGRSAFSEFRSPPEGHCSVEGNRLGPGQAVRSRQTEGQVVTTSFVALHRLDLSPSGVSEQTAKLNASVPREPISA